jgi:hypothetical protein
MLDALSLIQYETDKRIKFISSGTLGEPLIIPQIISEYSRVDYFYIFCGYVRRLTEWALERRYENTRSRERSFFGIHVITSNVFYIRMHMRTHGHISK